MDLQNRISQWIDAHRDGLLADLSRLVAIPSVRGEAEPGKPFGPGPAAALACAIDIARGHGLAVTDYDGYVACADLNGKPAVLDILGHLDVVDVGDGWDTDPFTAVLKDDGCLYGRGTDDDKGPVVAAMYAMLAVRELGLPQTANVRLIMGTDEESGSRDIAYYYRKTPPAPNTFSPDASFPVFNTEKGRYAPVFSQALTDRGASPAVTAFSGGYRANVLPADASAHVRGLSAAEIGSVCAPLAEKMGVRLTVSDTGDGADVSVTGCAAHASTPEEGINGITALLALLAALPLAPCGATETLRALAALFPHGDNEGRAIGIAMADELSGVLTLVLSILTLDEAGWRGEFDSRVPLCATEENCRAAAEHALRGAGFSVSGVMVAPHHTPADTPFVQTLLRSYERYTGRKGECLSMGGGTYVHDVPGGVAFGAGMPGFNSNLHGANERVDVEALLTASKIFAMVIAEMCCTEVKA